MKPIKELFYKFFKQTSDFLFDEWLSSKLFTK